MPFDFDTAQKLINSPPAQLLAGATLGGFVWKFFEKVEGVLNDATKYEIAVWLVGVEIGKKVEPWPSTFAKVFDRVFGEKHLSWRCFGRSWICSTLFGLCVQVIWAVHHPDDLPALYQDIKVGLGLQTHGWMNLVLAGMALFVGISLFNAAPDYISLLKTRYLLRRMVTGHTAKKFFAVLLDLLLTAVISGVAVVAAQAVLDPLLNGERAFEDFEQFEWFIKEMIFGGYVYGERGPPAAIVFYPAFFSCVWLILYVGSGLLVKAGRGFDQLFQWSSRKVEIETRPLSAIGLVAGTLVAATYWGFALGAHMLRK